MINIIWLALLVIGVIMAVVTSITTGSFDPLVQVTDALFNQSKTAVDLAIGLIGLMALWLGLMKLAEESGLIDLIAKAVRPIMVRLFPEIPADHPAMGAMIMNIAANMLGLGNAATPLGLKAMQELQKLNEKAETATNAMVTFLAINTSSVTIIPATVIGIRVSAGSGNPAEIIGTAIFATTCSTIVAVTAAKLFSKLPRFQLKPEDV
ncbi:MAG: nucleoside recognition protein [Candidatus Marinimicrobia bacterium]|nr:nucleoside recognition protein [Candidatus Neomarinimicrobiota bacterium]MCF7830034.1 nucleoside recognition protein [Candidatus Neomarinimicrobiota bacterium]